LTHDQVLLASPFLRRTPQQQRGRDKVRAILSTAEELLAELGHDELIASPQTLIARSGVTSGSFYSYFASCDDVVEVLVRLYLQEGRNIIDDLLIRAFATWRDAAEAIMDAYADWHRHATVRQLWLYANLGTEAQAESDEVDEYIALRSKELIERESHGQVQGTDLQYRVLGVLGWRLIQQAFMVDPTGDDTILREAKKAFIAYVNTFSPSEANKRDTSSPSAMASASNTG
jgi:AcrR family transcriptional regulator